MKTRHSIPLVLLMILLLTVCEMLSRSDYADYLERVNSINTFSLTYQYSRYADVTGSNPVDSVIYIEGKTAEVKDQGSLVYNHYTFQGWSLTEEGSVDYYPGDILTFGVSNITLWAAWQKNEYTLKYHIDGEYEGELALDQTSTFDKPLDIAADLSVQFWVGWNTNQDGSGIFYMFGDQIYLTGNTTLYGIAGSEQVYRIQYDIGDADGQTPSSQWGYAEDEVTLASQGDIANPGFKFMGWATSAGALEYDFEAGQAIALGVDIGNDETLHPVWELIPFLTVNYICEDITGGVAPSSEILYEGDKLTVPQRGVIQKKYYNFTGWEDLSGNSYVPGTDVYIPVTEVGVLDIYPQWELALSGSGSETSPFEINSAEALGWIGAEGSPYTLNDHYKQVDDISLEGIEFTPVGFSSNHYVADPFSGSFNGGDFTISSLSRTVSTGYRASGGLFCDVTGVVKNVTLTDYSLIIDTENIYRIGAVIGHLNGGEVSNVTAEGVIEVRGLSESARVGGLVGEISSPGIIRNSVSKGRIDVLDSVTVNNFSLGGILGYSYSSLNNDNKTSGTYIIECTADVIISSAAQSSSEIYAGGLIGQGIFLSCQNSWSFGDIFVPEGYVGGICGNANNSDFVNLFAMNSSLTGRMGDTFRVYRITYSGEMYTNTVYANKDMLINDSPLPANESFGPDGWDYTF